MWVMGGIPVWDTDDGTLIPFHHHSIIIPASQVGIRIPSTCLERSASNTITHQ